jgi:hypothetical protein
MRQFRILSVIFIIMITGNGCIAETVREATADLANRLFMNTQRYKWEPSLDEMYYIIDRRSRCTFKLLRGTLHLQSTMYSPSRRHLIRQYIVLYKSAAGRIKKDVRYEYLLNPDHKTFPKKLGEKSILDRSYHPRGKNSVVRKGPNVFETKCQEYLLFLVNDKHRKYYKPETHHLIQRIRMKYKEFYKD